MNTVLEEILRTGFTVAESGEKISIHSAVSEAEGQFLGNLVSELKPRLTLEAGLAFGVSALFICQALPAGAKHIAIDPLQFSGPWGAGWQGAGLAALKRAGYGDRVELHPEPSYVVLPQLAAGGVKIGFALIDGWHTFDFALVDLFYIDRMLEVGGIVALDDVHMPSIRKVCRFALTNLDYTVCGRYPATSLPPSWKQRAVAGLARKSKIVARLVKPEFSVPDTDLGLLPDCRCLALRKRSQSTREWDFHREF
jgi:hypothetical protein